MSDFEVRRLYSDGLPDPITPHSVQTLDNLLMELRNTRDNGYSCDNEQVCEGIICFGASILDSRNRPIAGVAVSLPAEKLSNKERRLIISNVQRIATKLSHRMGADLTQGLTA
jgi:DNA-binding IclR family transcriptional regulator